MSNDSENKREGDNILHPDNKERLPAAPGTSQSAEVVKQIIEQILANERRRARMEFIRLSIFFIMFMCVMLGGGVWFAKQLLVQLREERRLTEQTWRMIAGRGNVATMAPEADEVITPPALDREEVARVEKNINAVSDYLQSRPRDSSASVRAMIERQQAEILALNARLNDIRGNAGAAPAPSGQVINNDFIVSPIAEDLKLRMPVPSL